MKTPSFAHEIGESALAGVGRNNICEYLLFEMALGRQGMKTPSFAHEIGESALAGVGRNNICEYLLFEMALGRHENTKFCTRNWRICIFWQGWAGIIFVNIFYLKWLREGMGNWRICTGRGGQE